MDGTVPLRINRTVGWCSTVLGALTGLILGLWSFDGPLALPGWLGDYDQTSRRMVRLGHIACFGLGILNIILARELAHSGLSERLTRWASGLMVFGNVFLPLALFAAAYHAPLKYGLSLPATAVFVSLLLAAAGTRRPRPE